MIACPFHVLPQAEEGAPLERTTGMPGCTYNSLQKKICVLLYFCKQSLCLHRTKPSISSNATGR